MALDIRTRRALIGAGLVIFLDYLFHTFLTTPMEPSSYFVVKFVILFFMFNEFLKKTFTFERATIFAIVYGIIFGLYYQVIELSQVPDINFGSITITAETPLLAGAVWLAVHGGMFLKVAYVIHKQR